MPPTNDCNLQNKNARHIPYSLIVNTAYHSWYWVIFPIFDWVYFSINRKDVTTPVIAMALFYAGCMDALHTLAADRIIHTEADPVNLIPFTWAVCRLFNVLITILGITIVLSSRKRSNESSIWYLGLGTILLGGIAYATIHLCSVSGTLPQTMFPDSLVTRPYDVAPLILFLVAGVTVFRKLHKTNPSYFTYGLLLSLVPNIATQLHMALGSSVLFDNNFNIAHFLKIVSYTIPLTGLFLDYVQTYRNRKINLEKIELTNNRLLEQIEERSFIERELRASESRTLGILETTADAIITIDDAGLVLSYNPAAEKMFAFCLKKLSVTISRI